MHVRGTLEAKFPFHHKSSAGTIHLSKTDNVNNTYKMDERAPPRTACSSKNTTDSDHYILNWIP
jgi:hypothetical protein